MNFKKAGSLSAGTIIKNGLVLLVAILLLVLIFRGIDVRQVFMEIRHAKAGWVILSFLTSVIALFIRSGRWRLLIRSTGYEVGYKTTLYAMSIGYLANLAVPRLGEVSRCASLSRKEPVPFNVLFGTVVLERIVDLISLLICLLVTFLFEYDRIGQYLIRNIVQPVTSRFNLNILAIGGIVLLLVLIGMIYYLRKTKQNKVAAVIQGFVKGLLSIGQLQRPWLFVLQSLAIWVFYYLGVLTCFSAFDFTNGLGAGAGLFILVAGGFGMSAPVQGGIGAYHLLVSQGLILYGISRNEGLAFATLLHSLQLVMILVFGSWAVFYMMKGRAGRSSKFIVRSSK